MSIIPKFRNVKQPGVHTTKYWANNFLNGFTRDSESGVQIDEDSLMGESAVWCAVNFLASNIASLPCPIMKINGRRKEKDKEHPIFDILNARANDEMISMVYRETMLYHLFFWGVHYSVQIRNNRDKLIALWPVHPENVRLDRETASSPLTYYIKKSDGTEDAYRRDQILHIPALGINGLFGNSLIEYSKDSMGLMLAMRSYANLFFANGSNMGVIFEHPGKLGDTAHSNLTKSLATAYSGLGKSHKAFVAEEGMKVVKAGADPENCQLIEGRQFSISDVARWFNLPPHVLKDLSRATFSNIEQQSLELVKYSIRVWLVRLEQSFEAWLLKDTERKHYKILHNVEGLLRGDSAARAEYYTKQFQTSSITPNEIRELEDRNPIESPWADEPYIQLNMIPLSQSAYVETEKNNNLEKVSPEEKTVRSLTSFFTRKERMPLESIIKNRDRVTKRYLPLFSDVAQKIVNRESLAVKKEVKKQQGERSKIDFNKWIDEFYGDFASYVQKVLTPTARSFSEAMQETIAGEINIDPEFSDELSDELNSYIKGFARQYIESSAGQIRSLIEDDESLESVNLRADEWHEKRADKIVNNESVGIASMVARVTILGAGYSLTWRTRGKSCPFCNQLNGMVVSNKKQPFLESGTELDGGEAGKMKVRKTLYAPLHRGCDCVLVAA